MPRRFTRDFKLFFFRGLAVMLPLMLTLMIVAYVFQFIQNKVGRHLDTAAQWVVIQYWGLFSASEKWSFGGTDAQWGTVKAIWENDQLGFIGILLAFVLIYVVGRFVASFVGRSSLRIIEAGLRRLPVIRQLYPHVKQVTDTFFTEKKLEFSRVVAVQYPRKDIWSLGLVTARGMRKMRDTVGEDMLAIFIPSSPTPVTGYTIMVRKEDVIDLPLSIDEAFRFTISGGVVQPPGQQLPLAGVRESHIGDTDQLPREETHT